MTFFFFFILEKAKLNAVEFTRCVYVDKCSFATQGKEQVGGREKLDFFRSRKNCAMSGGRKEKYCGIGFMSTQKKFNGSSEVDYIFWMLFYF